MAVRRPRGLWALPGARSAPKTAGSPVCSLRAHTAPRCPHHFWGSTEARLGSPWKTTLGHVETTSVIFLDGYALAPVLGGWASPSLEGSGSVIPRSVP